tara:strand:- start:2458 stop:2802 length:345 start_codon:yes stop_codon:yes gene_type:complete
MKIKLSIITGLLIILIMPIAHSECIYPMKNFDMPNGSKASEKDMIDAQTKIKSYQAELGSYRDCLDEELASIPKQLENYDEISGLSLKKFNAAVDAETVLAEDWGTAVRAYKSQ